MARTFRLKAVSALLASALLLPHSVAIAQETDTSMADLTIGRVRGAETTFLVRTLDAEALQTVIFDGSNLATEDNGGSALTRLGPGLWTFTVQIDPTNVYEARLVLRDGSIMETVIDGGSLQAFRGLQTSVRAHDTQNQTYGIRSWVGKKALGALAKALRSSSFRWVLDRASTLGGRQVVNTIERYRFQLADKLDELARWEAVALQAVEDQVANLLMNLRVPASTARNAGFVIKQLLWIFM